ncbi:ATP-binding protein [Streptomyces nojiriensis]|uniref:ATP-binding protein n=1 Tax=Streptomyces nojiriensis TaxID=66374 RepID=UPI00368C0DEC
MDVVVSRTWKKPLELQFLAEPEEVAALRRILRLHLTHWNLGDLIEAAQLCVSELVANVITHVGRGTPTTLTLSVSGNDLRIEVQDPDARALPTLLSATPGEETGRGLALLDATAARWGVIPTASGKTTWCELSADVGSGSTGSCRCDGDGALFAPRGLTPAAFGGSASPLRAAAVERAFVDVVSDLLHWARVHGCDPDEILDRAQVRFEATCTRAN